MKNKKISINFFLFFSHRSSHSNSQTKPQDMFGRGFDIILGKSSATVNHLKTLRLVVHIPY
jgi:hypothetical protein